MAPVRAGSALRQGLLVAAASGLFLLALLARPGGERGVQVVDDLGLLVAALVGAALSLRTAGRHRGRRRTPWMLLGAALLAWAAGEGVWAWIEVLRRDEVPFPSVADVGYLMAPPLAAAAVLYLPARGISGASRVRTALDGLIVVTSLLLLSWEWVLGPLYRSGEGGLAGVVALAYPVSDVVIASMALLLLSRAGPRTRSSLVLVAAGLLALAVADSVYGYLENIGAYHTGHPVDVAWFVGYLLLGLAAYRSTSDDASEGGPVMPSKLGMSLPYLSVLVAMGIPVVQQIYRGRVDTFVVWCAAPLVCFVAIRQLLTLLDNLTLTRSLEGKVKARTGQLQASEERFRHQALHDPLTGLANQILFLDRCERALLRTQREGRPVALLFIDVDHFKFINDSLGHHVGDKLLAALAARISSILRATDTLARFSGDEFVVVSEGMSEQSNALALAERIFGALASGFTIDGHELVVTVSIGIAISTPTEDTPEALLQAADMAMYHAKLAGRARHAIFDQTMRQDALDRLVVEEDLRAALEHGEIVLHYQPIVCLRSGRVTSVEALVRLHARDGGLTPPDQFISLAEATGLIVPLGRRVLEQACQQMRKWHLENAHLRHLSVAVNVAPRQLRDSDITDTVAHVLRRTGLPASSLTIEVTESAITDEAAVGRLHALKELGVRVALDDFGTGYSALSALHDMPIDTLKIDKSFIDELHRHPDRVVVARSVIRLARSLGLESVAEGVEVEDQLRLLDVLGCDRAQGYLFARPLPAEDIEPLLSTALVPGIADSRAEDRPAGPRVRIELGPLPSQSALAFTRYASAVLDDVEGDDVSKVPPVVIETMRRYLSEWASIASENEVFAWSGNENARLLRMILEHWQAIASSLSELATASGTKLAPPEAEAFYEPLVSALLTALAVDREDRELEAVQLDRARPRL